MSQLMEEKLKEIVDNPEKIRSIRSNSRQEQSESDFDAEMFKGLYEAILHLVNHVELLNLWNGSFCISHPDLTKNNILVSYETPTNIVGFIDWDGCRILPWVSTI